MHIINIETKKYFKLHKLSAKNDQIKFIKKNLLTKFWKLYCSETHFRREIWHSFESWEHKLDLDYSVLDQLEWRKFHFIHPNILLFSSRPRNVLRISFLKIWIFLFNTEHSHRSFEYIFEKLRTRNSIKFWSTYKFVIFKPFNFCKMLWTEL